LRHDGYRTLQAILRDSCDVLPVDQNATCLHIAEALYQDKQSGFAAA
jgi:hypothetical protein